MFRKTFLVIILILPGAFCGMAQELDTDVPIGWAVVPANGVESTTGGGDASPTIVTTFSELKTAVQDMAPRVIIVSGTIKTTDGGGYALKIAGNKTIIGADSSATIYGGIEMSGVSNVIVRNLNIHGIWPNSGPDDAVALHNSHHVWIDHLNIWDAGDGILDITNESNYVTVSWCKFWYTNPSNPHRLACLIGSGGGDHPEDWDKLKVTYHHCWYNTLVDQRMPRIMYGQVHVFNDYYTCSGNSYCIGVGSYGSALIENNYFKEVNNPHQFMYDVYCWITARGNVYDNTSGSTDDGKGGTRDVGIPGWAFPVEAFENPPYLYSMDTADDIPDIVSQGAGPHSQYGEIGLMPIPGNGATDVSTAPTLQWKRGSQGGTASSYIVSLGTTNPPPQLTTVSEQSCNPDSLSQGTVYYWRVDQDTSGGIIQGKVWTFRTEGFITSVDEIEQTIPPEFKLYPVYSNPFNSETKIQYAVSRPARITISAFDITGRLIGTLLDQKVDAGEHSFTWNASDLAPGTYFIKLCSDNFSTITKCILTE